MKIKKKDHLSNLMAGYVLSKREEYWMLFYFARTKGEEFVNQINVHGDIRYFMGKAMQHCKQPTGGVLSVMRAEMVPDNCLDWFENSEFFFCWLYIAVSEQMKVGEQIENKWPIPNRVTLPLYIHEILTKNLLNISYKQRAILMFDYWEAPNFEKKKILEKFRNNWRINIQVKKKLSWVSKRDEQKRAQEMYDFFMLKHAYKDSFINFSGTLDSLISNIIWLRISDVEIDEALKTLKPRLAQESRREKSKTIRQINLELTKTGVSKLDKLAKQFDISRRQAIEILISKESELNAKGGGHLKNKIAYLKRLDDVNLDE